MWDTSSSTREQFWTPGAQCGIQIDLDAVQNKDGPTLLAI